MNFSTTTWPVLFVCLLLAGCYKYTEPESSRPRSVPASPFAIDGEPEDLGLACLTDELENCGVARSLEDAISTLWQLHRQQMMEMDSALRSLSGVLSRADDIPYARITAPPLNADNWVDPKGRYPADLELRLQFERGLDRMGENTVRDMDGALANLKKIARTHKKAWDATLDVYPRGLVLPDEIQIERQYATVQAVLKHGKYTFEVPKHLGQIYIKRDVAPWVAIASHVVTRSGMKYKAVGEHRTQLPAALVVAGKGPFVINEHRPLRQRYDFVSKITPTDACKKLRGELRFTRADQAIPLRAVYLRKSTSGGRR